MRLRVNPENLTEIWATFDGREPTMEDHDFGADFYWQENQIDVANAVREIVDAANTALAKGE